MASKIALFTGYGTPNQVAMAGLAHPIPFPNARQRAILEYPRDLGEAATTWEAIWQEIRHT